MKKRIIKLTSLCAVLTLLACLCSCSLTDFSVEELRTLYPKAVAASLGEDLFYWKETVNNGKETALRKCNVFAEIDKKYEPIRNDNGDYSNMDVDISETANNKTMQTIQCGDAPSASGAGAQNYLFRTSYQDGTVSAQTKAPMSAKEFVNSAEFQTKYSLDVMLKELEFLTVEDMDFDNELADLVHKGNVVKATFKVKESYLERYRAEFGTDSLFAGSKKVNIEFAYDRIASILVYTEKSMDSKLSVDTEAYKLQIVYFGPKVSLPKYDEMKDGVPVWKDTQAAV